MVQVIVNSTRGEMVMVDLCNTDEQFKNMTVLQLKEKIREKPQVLFPEGENVRLIFMDKMLEDSDLLIAYGIKHMPLLPLKPDISQRSEIRETSIFSTSRVVSTGNNNEDFLSDTKRSPTEASD